MNFEHLLYIYWSKGFFYNKTLNSFNVNIIEFLNEIKNFNFFNKKKFIKRFELIFLKYKKDETFLKFSLNKRKIINMYISKISNINYYSNDLLKYNIIRLYLIQSFRGFCHFLGKPAKGQRTWSNANNSKKFNTFAKYFVIKIKKKFNLYKKLEIKNKKLIIKKKKKKFLK